MLETVRRKAADSLRTLTAISVGERFKAVRLARQLVSEVAERLSPSREEAPPARAEAPAESAQAPRASAEPPRPVKTEIDAGQLRGEMDGGQAFLLVDVREPAETAQGIIPGARLIPMNSVLERIGELREQDKPVVVYCASGSRSRFAATHLRDRGVKQVYNLAGGIESWRQVGGEVHPPR